MDALLVAELCSRDLTAIKVRLRGGSGERQEVVIASAYFPGDATGAPPPKEVEALVSYCRGRNVPLLLGCDANAHHTVWGSTNTNSRGRDLLEYLVGTDLEILNRGNRPTFQNIRRREVLDLTLCSLGLSGLIRDWKVSEEESLSDHKQIIFRLTLNKLENPPSRDPRKTKWGSFQEELQGKLMTFPSKYGSREELEHAAIFLRGALVSSFENNCPLRCQKPKKGALWWNNHLERLRKQVRKLCNRANKTRKSPDWDAYKVAQQEYKDAIKGYKRKGWESFCEEASSIPATARIHKILAKNPEARLGPIKLGSGKYSEDEEQALRHLVNVHFPGFCGLSLVTADRGGEGARHARTQWNFSSKIVSVEKVEWAIESFLPFKSPGADGIYPALLQKGLESIRLPLTKLFRASIAMGHVPSAWKDGRVVFIPKPGREGYDTAKDFRPISLTSFVLKALEKLVERYIRDVVLTGTPLHGGQHAFQAGSSVETALHAAVAKIEQQLELGGYAVGTFLDIEGAFNNTPPETIWREASKCGVPDHLVGWIKSMLHGRVLETKWGDTCLKGVATRGCPQGGVLSPLLWCIVVDGLLRRLNEAGFYAQGYADDFAIIIRGAHLDTLMGLTESALRIVELWCQESGLAVNPEKTNLVVFTRKYKVGPIRPPIFCKKELKATSSVKYLGVTLDNKLTWAEHLELQSKKFITTLWICRRAFGRSWGLGPEKILWLYTAILKPRLTYAAIVWWRRTQLKTAQTILGRLQAVVFRGVTGAMRTTPVAAMGFLLNEEPLHISLVAEAAQAMGRLRASKRWTVGGKHTCLPSDITSLPSLSMGQDRMTRSHNFAKLFKTFVPVRSEWRREANPWLQGEIWYTDGSKGEMGTGSGVYDSARRREFEYPLGGLATVFQAEVYAILMCTEININEKAAGKQITICSDSQAAIAAIGKPTAVSTLVWECKKALNCLAKGNRVSLLWVPGHSGIRGNEKADKLARKGAAEGFIGPEPVLGLAPCCVKYSVKEWVREKQEQVWVETKGCRQAKLALGTKIRKGRSKTIMKLPKKDLNILVQIFTGHCHLNYHLNRIGLSTTKDCRYCGEGEESSIHVLCQCPALARHRMFYLGSAFVESEDIPEAEVGDILGFLKSAGVALR